MPQILRIPKAAVSMREGTLVQWLVADGATVVEGQPIFTLELEKSTMDVESPAAGVIRQTGAAGTTYKVGAIIGEIGAAAAAARGTCGAAYAAGPAGAGRSLTSMRPWRPGTPPPAPDLSLSFRICHSADFTHRGAAGKPDISLAVGAAGDLLIELVRLHDAARRAPGPKPARKGLLLSATTAEFDDAVRAHESAGRTAVSTGPLPLRRGDSPASMHGVHQASGWC
jgi:pyruvate/2-oxoglutarate dehydrogenase complex dihydrolipoamide acyltransferase (E2) component